MGRVWELEPRLYLIWNLSKRNMAQQCPHESLLHYRGWGGRIRTQKWYLRYTVSLLPPPPRTLHWPFVTETAFSTNLLPEQQTRSKAHFNFCSSRSTVLLRHSKIVLRKAKWDAGARKVLNNPQSGFHAIFYFSVELPYFLFGLVCFSPSEF